MLIYYAWLTQSLVDKLIYCPIVYPRSLITKVWKWYDHAFALTLASSNSGFCDTSLSDVTLSNHQFNHPKISTIHPLFNILIIPKNVTLLLHIEHIIWLSYFIITRNQSDYSSLCDNGIFPKINGTNILLNSTKQINFNVSID